MTNSLDALFHRLSVWKGSNQHESSSHGISTGFDSLDACLPGKGWPQAGLTELLLDHPGIGELSLLLPAIARLSKRRGVLLISPPFVPYAPALDQAGIDLSRLLIVHACSMRDALACAETALRSGGCGAVILWNAGLPANSPQDWSPLALRRLHLAALHGNAMGIAFRSATQASQASPALLRILLRRMTNGLQIALFKRRGMTGEVRLLLEPYAEALRSEVAPAFVSPVWSATTVDHLSATLAGDRPSEKQEPALAARRALLPVQ